MYRLPLLVFNKLIIVIFPDYAFNIRKRFAILQMVAKFDNSFLAFTNNPNVNIFQSAHRDKRRSADYSSSTNSYNIWIYLFRFIKYGFEKMKMCGKVTR